MAINLIKNGDFSQGYGDHRAYKYTTDGDMSELQVSEITNPKDWETFFVHGQPVPWDDDNDIGFAQPEVGLETDVPDPNRIMDGTTHSLHGFGFFKIIDCGHLQRVSVVAGKRYRLTAYAHAWSSLDDRPRSSEGVGDAGYYGLAENAASPEVANHNFYIGFGPTIDIDNACWGTPVNIYNEFHMLPAIEFVAESNEVYVFLRDTVMWPYKHNDYYWSQISLVETDGEPEPEPVEECRGTPRVQYERTYVLFPQEASTEWMLGVIQSYLEKGYRHTFGQSADDSAIGDLDIRNIIMVYERLDSFNSSAMHAFYREFYPGVFVTEEIGYIEHVGASPSPSTSPPPTGGEPDPIVHYSGNFVGLQHYIPKDGWLDYIREAKPTVTKCFSCGDAIRAKQAQPQMLSVWRKLAGDDGSWLIGDRQANARKLVALYEAELETTCNNMGISRAEALKWIDVIESLNETVPSNNANHIRDAVEFDVFFSNYVAEVFDGALKAGILNVAVGNPYAVEDDGGSEIKLMLPCARESHEGRAILGYHGYWSADEKQSYMADNWKWHAGRWQEWDKVFNEHGYYPTYYLGECGICYSYPESDGEQFVATKGWKSCGDFQSYIDQIENFDTYIFLWNAQHQGRCFGSTIFIYGHDGWWDFDFEPGDLAELADAMKEYA